MPEATHNYGAVPATPEEGASRTKFFLGLHLTSFALFVHRKSGRDSKGRRHTRGLGPRGSGGRGCIGLRGVAERCVKLPHTPRLLLPLMVEILCFTYFL